MGPKTKKLISVCSLPLCDSQPKLPEKLLSMAGVAGDDVVELLTEKNGFYCFESALHVLPSDCSSNVMNIEEWNSDELWRNEYGGEIEGYLFFAEDVFGLQFALRDGKVYRFDPESGEVEEKTNGLEEWAGKILEDYEYETGYPLARAWQERNGPLMPGKRLVPKIPFMLGGEYEIDNLYALDAVEAVRHRADMWKQMKDLPDGATVRLKVVE